MVQPRSSDRSLVPEPRAERVPVASMVESVVGCKWSVRLLRVIAHGSARPSALLRACPGLSAKVMNERLRKMTRFGIVSRSVLGEKPPIEVEYGLTDFGRRFMNILAEVQRLQDSLDRGDISQAGAEGTADRRLAGR